MTKRKKPLTVAKLARQTGVSVRTLHYYDDIGLLVADRSDKGYRLYGREHIFRLQQILIGRSFGHSLEEIRSSLDDPSFNQAAALREQRSRLVARVEETEAIISSIDEALSRLVANDESKSDMSDMFKGFDPATYEAEAEQKWGKTDAWKQASQRKKNYTPDDWAAIKDESEAIYRDAAALVQTGVAPESSEGAQIVARHREHIERWFYDVPPQMHLGLAGMYETDDRFRATMDAFREGTTDWLIRAIRAAYA